ncbi:hypothetical protein N7373_06830 [Achromobacter mucicolens]|uniref:hypothetical protein n=1 Tax=Achromobacter mucicolens TaxID=1389922 RepID=UPI00244C0DE5|nr:hypothetical protein [Achromobacter mucicolens]MDH0091154.1 hypothetical protein [Achromobacter mucicolens]
MANPATFHGYRDPYTVDCERVLVIPAHASMLHADIVIDLQPRVTAGFLTGD